MSPRRRSHAVDDFRLTSTEAWNVIRWDVKHGPWSDHLNPYLTTYPLGQLCFMMAVKIVLVITPSFLHSARVHMIVSTRRNQFPDRTSRSVEGGNGNHSNILSPGEGIPVREMKRSLSLGNLALHQAKESHSAITSSSQNPISVK